MGTQIEKISIDTVFEWLLDRIKNHATREQLVDMTEQYTSDLDNTEVVELYIELGGNLDGLKVVE